MAKGIKKRGTNNDDILKGTAGNDRIEGLGGNDILIGRDGNDRLDGGDGNDVLRGGDGKDHLKGGNGDDILYGGDDNDHMDGGEGNDTLFGGAGDDHMKGGKGTDTLNGGAGNDKLDGGKGEDTLNGGAGDDKLKGGKGDDTLNGGIGNDDLKGGTGNDVLRGGAGNDILDGGQGNDSLFGGAGDDWLFGDGGSGHSGSGHSGSGSGPEVTFDDYLDGGAGNDVLVGGQGNDTLLGGAGNDFLFGDSYVDLQGSGSGHSGSGHSGSGHSGSGGGAGPAFDDYLDGGAGNDVLLAQQGDDIANYTMVENLGPGFADIGTADSYDGGTGTDTLRLTLTHGEFALASMQQDIADYQAFLAAHSNPFTDNGPTFDFTTFDLSATDFETLDVVLTNVAPTANADTAGGHENETLTVDVLGNDTDPDHLDVLTLDQVSIASVTGLSGPTGGTVSIVGNQLRFDPGTDFDELDVGDTATVVVDYTIIDLAGAPSTSTATITVTGTNDAPVAVADTAGGHENQTLTIDVLANDTDVDGDDNPSNFSLDSVSIASVTGLSGPTGGTASIVGNQLQFAPGTDFDELDVGDTATVTVDYTMSDDSGAPSSSTVTITVTGTNDAPVAVADTAGGHENQTLTIDVLTNDTDVDGDDNPSNFTLDSVSIASVTGLTTPTGGSVSVVGNQLQFNPGADFDELDVGDTATMVVNYTMSDDSGAPSSSTVTITVTGTNDAPVAVADTGAGHENQVLTLDVLANDTDVDGDDNPSNFTLDSVSIASVTGLTTPTGGSVSVVGNQLQFNPGADFDELDVGDTATVVVDYIMSDDSGAPSTSTTTITVTGTNDGPVAVADTVGGSGGGFGANILFVSDSGVGSDIASVLAADGHTVTSVLDNFTGGVTPALAGDLTSYDAVFWSASGDAYGNTHNTSMFANLEAYVNAGGRVFVTGYDSIASPSDGPLINFLGGTGSSDFGAPSTATSGANSLTTGAVDIQGVTPTGYYGDTDTLYAAPGTDIVVGSSYGGTGASWALRSLGTGEIAYVSNGQFGSSGSHVSWTNTAAGGDGAYNAALRNFAFNSGESGVDENEVLTVDVLANDTDVDGDDNPANFSLDSVSIASVTGLSTLTGGSVSVVGNQLQFNPGTDFDELDLGDTATVVVDYTMSDDSGAPSSSTATITVTGTNDAPVAVNDVLSGGGSGSGTIVEVEPNDSIATAQSLDGHFALVVDANVANSATQPHVSVQGTGNNTADYYSFTVPEAGTTMRFDIDFGMPDFDPYIHLWNSDGVRIASNDDSSIDPGSVHSYDSEMSYTFSAPGTYYISVGRYPGFSNPDNPVPNGADYVLQVSTTADILTLTDEDTAVTIAAADLLANDTDVDNGAVLSVAGVSAISALGASVSLSGTDITYDPSGVLDYLAEGETVTDSFTYTVTDEHGASDTATVTFTVEGTNDGPVAVVDTGAGHENEVLTLDVLANDTDVDGADNPANFSLDSVSIASVTGLTTALGGSVSVVGNQLQFNPGTDFDELAVGDTATVVVDYTMSDDSGAPSSSTATITVTGTNDAPVAQDVTLEVNQLGNGGFEATPDFDGWNVNLATAGVSTTYSSSATVNRSGTAIAGDDAVAVLSFTGSVYPTPYGTGFGPTITSDPFDGQSGDTVRFVYELSSGGDQAKGTGYIRDANTNAIVQTIFNYQVPFSGSTGVQTIDLTLAQTGEFVIDFRVGSYDATGGYYVGATLELGFAGIIREGLSEDTPFTFDGTTFLAGVTDVDGGAPVLHSVSASSANGASVVIVGGDVVYDPTGALDHLAEGEELVDTFEFTISDGNGGFDTATASITVIGENDAPVAEPDKIVIVPEGNGPTTLNIHAPTDVDGDTLTATVNGLPTNGTVSLANGTAVTNGQVLSVAQLTGLTFTAGANAGGTSSGFGYTVNDGNGGSDTVTVSVDVFEEQAVVSGPTQVLDFEGLPFHVPEGYGGFSWSSLGSYYEPDGGDSPDILASGNPGSVSGSQSAWNGWAGKYSYITLQDSGTFNFEGAYFREWQEAYELTLHGYNDGLLQGSEVVDVTTAWQFFVSDLDGIDQLVIEVSSGGHSGMGISSTGWWGMDDFQFSTSATAVYNQTLNGAAGNDVLVGAAGDDTIIGNAGEDHIEGGDGDDTIYGGNGDDLILGERGNDYLYGGAGDDILGPGNVSGPGETDWLDGGAGTDTASFINALSPVNADLQSGLATVLSHTINMASIENVNGSGHNDTLMGDSGANRLAGRGGNDILDGRGGDDFLIGGGGSDLFVFTNGSGNDTIADFQAGAGSVDVIDLSDFGFADLAGVQAAATDTGNDVVIQLDADDSVTLQNVSDIFDLHQDDFLF